MEEDEFSRLNQQNRVVVLGDMLFLLKDCAGFGTFIDSLKTRDLESVFFELSVATVLHRNGFEVAFVEQSGIKGEDYDLIATRDGISISVEAKSRRARILLAESKLSSTLKQARTRLPKSGPGMVFVSISVEWTAEPGSETIISGCINSFLRNSSRVNCVVVLWEAWTELGSAKALVTLVRQTDNQHPRSAINLGQIVKPMETNLLLDVTPENQPYCPSFW